MPRRHVPLVELLRARVDDPAAAIAEGLVVVDGALATNLNAKVASTASIKVLAPKELRGVAKLSDALDRFGVDCTNVIALDVGAAAGGFTTALLERGAARVYAVDVGHGQLLGALRTDRRVVNLERTNVSDLTRAAVPDPIDLITIDVSYLPLGDAVKAVSATDVEFTASARLLGLVKPMFELRLGQLPAPEEAPNAVEPAVAAIEAAGWSVNQTIQSGVGGAGGAIEYWIDATRLL